MYNVVIVLNKFVAVFFKVDFIIRILQLYRLYNYSIVCTNELIVIII